MDFAFTEFSFIRDFLEQGGEEDHVRWRILAAIPRAQMLMSVKY